MQPVSAATSLPPDRVVLPAYDDPVAAGAATALGGPPGAHARVDRRFWTPVRWLVLLTLLTSVLGFWQKSPCRVHPWEDQYQYTRGCYTDVFALYFAERLNEGATPYLDHPVEYPVGIGAVMAVAAQVTEGFPQAERPRRFYDVTWALLTAAAVVVVVTTARLAGRRRPWDAAMFAVAPLLVLHGSTNWDLVALALAGLGLVQWARSRPLVAGLLLGAATATKLYPVLFLVPLLALCLRAGRLRPWALTAVATVLTPVALSLPVYLASPSFADLGSGQVQVAASPLDRLGDQGLAALAPHTSAVVDGQAVEGVNAAYRFVELNRLRPADWDSLWFALQTARGAPLDTGGTPTVLNAAVAVLFVAALAGVVLLALRAPRRPRLAALLFLTVLAFLLTNKVWSPQFSLWLVPLALLARPRWRPFLAWQATEALVLFTRFYFFVGNAEAGQGIDVGWFLGAVLLRDAVLVGYAAFVVRDALHPERDVVRTDGVDDPMGGPLDGAPDRRPDRQPVPAPAEGRDRTRLQDS
jgi:uncharacterized membrane protein